MSHETIYRSLFVQARGVLKKELQQHLRSKRTIRRSIHATQKGSDHGQIKDMGSTGDRCLWRLGEGAFYIHRQMLPPNGRAEIL